MRVYEKEVLGRGNCGAFDLEGRGSVGGFRKNGEEREQ